MSQSDAEAEEEELISFLSDFGTPTPSWMSEVDKDNRNLLHYAARSGLLACVKLLIKSGLDVNQIRRWHFGEFANRPDRYCSMAISLPEGSTLDVVEDVSRRFMENPIHQYSEQGQWVGCASFYYLITI